MKKLAYFLLMLIPGLRTYPATWYGICPDTIEATHICFGVGSWLGTICSPSGMYIWNDNTFTWNFYTYGLPVTGAASLDGQKILVAMGCGTWSDGVYTFDLQTHLFEIAEWIVEPAFLTNVYFDGAGEEQKFPKYYAGSRYSGLYESTDGISWSAIPCFNGKTCTAMDYSGNFRVVSETGPGISNIYWSDDNGTTWNQSPTSVPALSDLKFNNQGELYGICPDFSNSSGLWYSSDHGQSWQVKFWSDNMSAVGFDAMGTIFTGWESPTAGNEGVAIYDPSAPPPGLTFINQTLPNTNINKILMNPSMSAIAIFCCTDGGVYRSDDYIVGMEEPVSMTDPFILFPNPTSGEINIRVEPGSDTRNISILEIRDASGKKVDEIQYENYPGEMSEFTYGSGQLTPGVYYFVLCQNKSRTVRKVMIH